jgi:hypothetical protein
MLGCSLVCVCEREGEREVSADKISRLNYSLMSLQGLFKDVRKINVTVIACEQLHMCKTREQNILQQRAV